MKIRVLCDECGDFTYKLKGNIGRYNFHKECYQKYMNKNGGIRFSYRYSDCPPIEQWPGFENYKQECERSEQRFK